MMVGAPAWDTRCASALRHEERARCSTSRQQPRRAARGRLGPFPRPGRAERAVEPLLGDAHRRFHREVVAQRLRVVGIRFSKTGCKLLGQNGPRHCVSNPSSKPVLSNQSLHGSPVPSTARSKNDASSEPRFSMMLTDPSMLDRPPPRNRSFPRNQLMHLCKALPPATRALFFPRRVPRFS